ncbi:ABC transporter ATP-binding protein [Phenylobacterium sp.]|uniref:ABC transporter ATP-binding protein n=1 Tax=Phenylobacterium sp. TaxID=1871053 RepID=UPI0025E643C3|nr:ABC transporter ATP-binding protein [Phenylobacterium sp.]
MSGVLEARGLTLKRGRREILAGLDLSLRAGEVTALVGPNGAGKSTLLAGLCGLLAPAAGAVRLDGQDLSALPPMARARRIGFLPQMPEIAWPLEVRILVGLGRTPHIGARGLSAADARIIDAALEEAGAADLAERDASTLSGGERARVMIARVLAGEPDWLLADEPLAGLDPGCQIDAAETLVRRARAGCGVVLTLHDLTLAARIADRVLVLAEGRLLADGPPEVALVPDVLARAFAVRTALRRGPEGASVDVLGRA